MKEIGIIGFGRFGELTANHLKKEFRVFASDVSDKSRKAKKVGVTFTSIKECAGKEIVILAVPISKFKKTLKSIVFFLKKGALVLDVCSVKEMPVNAMKEILPLEVDCLGTHPLFGPDTAKNGFKGLKIVLCPVRTQKLNSIKSFLKKAGFEILIATPEEHDRQISKSLLLLHFLGKALLEIHADKVNITTQTHERIMELIQIVQNDSNQLFEDMHLFNRFARASRENLIKELTKINNGLKNTARGN